MAVFPDQTTLKCGKTMPAKELHTLLPAFYSALLSGRKSAKRIFTLIAFATALTTGFTAACGGLCRRYYHSEFYHSG